VSLLPQLQHPERDLILTVRIIISCVAYHLQASVQKDQQAPSSEEKEASTPRVQEQTKKQEEEQRKKMEEGTN
jgi:hypothetical protein